MKYYTDNELIELIEMLDSSEKSSLDSHWVARQIKERLEQKERTLSFTRDRLDIAAKNMGYTLINELVDEEGC